MPPLEELARRRKTLFGGAGKSRIDARAVVNTYARWAPIYDFVFGLVFRAGRRAAVERINALAPGRILECGVGTGISLPFYKPEHRIVGIDLSPDMLERAEARVADEGLSGVEALRVADAADLDERDATFDASVAMFVITVVPDPKAVMAELERVTRPGGTVILVGHFADQRGWRKRFGETLAPLSAHLGWHMDFAVERVLGRRDLKLVERRRVGPFGFVTVLVFERL